MKIFFALLLCAVCAVSCATRMTDGTELTRFEYKRAEMGLPCHLRLVAHTREAGEPAGAAS